MNIDYWRQFLKTGSVRDYLAYRNSINSADIPEAKNEQPDNGSDGNSYPRDKNKGK